MANKKIAGITVEIGGDTTKLGKALSDVDKQSRNLKNELKEVDSALKLDPKNTELLAQKQQILAEAIENSKKRLERLKEVQEQVTAQYQRGEIDAGQYRAFQREVATAEAELNNFQTEAQNTQRRVEELNNEIGGGRERFREAGETIEKAGNKVSAFGDKMTEAGKKASAASAVIVGAAAASYKAWEKTDAGYDTIVKKTGATGEALEGLEGVADSVFTSLPVNMGKVGTAVGEINTRFSSTGDELEALTRKFVKYSEINDSDVNGSIDNVSAALKAFGLGSESAGDLLDKLTSIAQRTGIPVSQLESLLLSQSATFKEMGLSIGESAELLGQFEINGVDASTAIAALRKAQQNATASGKTLSESLGENITAIKNASNETEALQIATDLFGKKGAAAMTQAIRENRVALGELDGSLTDTAGLVDSTFEATLDAPAKLKVTLNNVKLSASQLAETAMQMVVPALQKVTSFIKNLTDRFNSLTKSQKETIIKIAGVAAAIAPVLLVIGKLTTGIGAVTSAAGKLFSVIAANPVVAVIAAITAALVLLYTKSESFREFINGFVADIAAFAEVVAADLEDMWKDVQPIFKDIWSMIQSVLDILEGPTKVALSGVMELFKIAWNTIKAVWDVVVPYFRTIVNGISAVFSVVKAVLTGDFQGAWDGIKAVFSASKQFFVQVWKNITDAFSSVGKFFKDVFGYAWRDIKEVFSGVGDFFGGIWDTIVKKFSVIGTKVAEAIGGTFKSAINSVIGTIEGALNLIPRAVNGAIKAINKLPGVSISRLDEIELPRLAKGGTLSEGQAIVAEAGPELIQMLNGKARVTPLTNSSRNTAVQATEISPQRTVVHQTYNIYVKEFASPQDARTTSQELARLERQTNFGKGLATT